MRHYTVQAKNINKTLLFPLRMQIIVIVFLLSILIFRLGRSWAPPGVTSLNNFIQTIKIFHIIINMFMLIVIFIIIFITVIAGITISGEAGGLVEAQWF